MQLHTNTHHKQSLLIAAKQDSTTAGWLKEMREHCYYNAQPPKNTYQQMQTNNSTSNHLHPPTHLPNQTYQPQNHGLQPYPQMLTLPLQIRAYPLQMLTHPLDITTEPTRPHISITDQPNTGQGPLATGQDMPPSNTLPINSGNLGEASSNGNQKGETKLLIRRNDMRAGAVGGKSLKNLLRMRAKRMSQVIMEGLDEQIHQHQPWGDEPEDKQNQHPHSPTKHHYDQLYFDQDEDQIYLEQDENLSDSDSDQLEEVYQEIDSDDDSLDIFDDVFGSDNFLTEYNPLEFSLRPLPIAQNSQQEQLNNPQIIGNWRTQFSSSRPQISLPRMTQPPVSFIPDMAFVKNNMLQFINSRYIASLNSAPARNNTDKLKLKKTVSFHTTIFSKAFKAQDEAGIILQTEETHEQLNHKEKHSQPVRLLRHFVQHNPQINTLVYQISHNNLPNLKAQHIKTQQRQQKQQSELSIKQLESGQVQSLSLEDLRLRKEMERQVIQSCLIKKTQSAKILKKALQTLEGEQILDQNGFANSEQNNSPYQDSSSSSSSSSQSCSSSLSSQESENEEKHKQTTSQAGRLVATPSAQKQAQQQAQPYENQQIKQQRQADVHGGVDEDKYQVEQRQDLGV